MKECGIYCLGEAVLNNANNRSYVKAVISAFPLLSDRSRAVSSMAELVVPAAFSWEHGDSRCASLVPSIPRGPPQPGVTATLVLNIGKNYAFAPQRMDANLWLKAANTMALSSFLKESEKEMLRRGGHHSFQYWSLFSVLAIYVSQFKNRSYSKTSYFRSQTHFSS